MSAICIVLALAVEPTEPMLMTLPVTALVPMLMLPDAAVCRLIAVAPLPPWIVVMLPTADIAPMVTVLIPVPAVVPSAM